MVANYNIPSAFFKGLKEDNQSSVASDRKNITMLRCLRWVMKKYGMLIEIKRANVIASTQMSIQLVKYDKDMQPVDLGVDIGITDSRIEKGLFELEYKIMQYADIEPMKGLNITLEWLRRSKISLPLHSSLCNKIIMNGHTMRIGYLGIDPNTNEDLFGGLLLLDGSVVANTTPQARMGNVMDSLEDALFSKKRAEQRKGIQELMIKLNNADEFDEFDEFL